MLAVHLPYSLHSKKPVKKKPLKIRGGGQGASVHTAIPFGVADISKWLVEVGALDAMSEALMPLLDGCKSTADAAELLRELEPVQKALEGGKKKIAGVVCEAAAREARKNRMAKPFKPSEIADPPIREVFEKAVAKQAEDAHDPFAGAKQVYTADGLPPWMWGISKNQFVTWLEFVRAAHDAGHITNQPDPDKPFYYPAERFDSREVGPNMHQINRDVIMPMSAASEVPLPGVSTALGFNLATGGLRCDLFFSHAWNEGVYELGRNVLASWPDECEGAYLCCLSNPQNLDISSVLNHADGSPFERVLGATPRPKAMIMLANRNTPIHTRLWCVLEAHIARLMQIVMIRIEGPATQLITGARGEALKAAELQADKDSEEATTTATEEFQRSLHESGAEAKAHAEKRRDQLAARIQQNKQKIAKLKLEVLLAPASELIDLEAAECSNEDDEVKIRKQVSESEDAITSLVANLIHDNVCDISTLRGTKLTSFDGPLGPLSLVDDAITIKADEPTKVMQMGAWLRLGPAATNLKVENLDGIGARVVVVHGLQSSTVQVTSLNLSHNKLDAEAGKALAEALKVNNAMNTINLDGFDLPVKKLKGTEPVEELDFASKGLGIASGIVIAKLIEGNATLTVLNLFNNKLGVEGATAIAKMLEVNTTLTSLDLYGNNLGNDGAIAIAKGLEGNTTLTKVNLRFNYDLDAASRNALREAVKGREGFTLDL